MADFTLIGLLYDGDTSAPIEAELVVRPDGSVHCSAKPEFDANIRAFTVSSRIGQTPRHLSFGDDIRFETRDNDTVDAICNAWMHRNAGLADRLERNMKLVVVGILVVALGGFAFVKYGIPAASGPITAMIPRVADTHLGADTMELMDEQFFEESELAPERQEALLTVFESLLPADPHPALEYQLLFRSADDMPNAFALPNGTIVMTDQLVTLSEKDEELASILLHEIGHVEERHSMQTLVRQAGLGLIILLVTGDVNSMSSVVLLLPAWLAQASYSQNLETSADTFALQGMRERNMDTNSFADIMQRLGNFGKEDAEHGSDNGDEPSDSNSAFDSIFDYLSTHPATDERIARFRTAAPASGTPALTE